MKHHNWTLVKTKGDNPGPRAGATLLYLKETLILVRIILIVHFHESFPDCEPQSNY